VVKDVTLLTCPEKSVAAKVYLTAIAYRRDESSSDGTEIIMTLSRDKVN